MKDTNVIVIAGRLTRDGELSYTTSGTALCKISIAVNRSVKKNDQWVDEASFFDCSMWGKRGEALAQYLVKGQQIIVSGELKQDRWEKEGVKRSRVTIHVNDLQLVGGKKSENQNQEYSPKTDPKHNNAYGQGNGAGGGFEDDSDIPF